MKWFTSATFWGVVLILAGILFLLQTFNIIPGGSVLFSTALVVFSVLFLSVYFGDRRHWWALIPGIILLGLAATISVSVFFPEWDGNVSGAIFLGSIGVSFWAVYFDNRRNWWAIIPGGVLLTLAAVAGVEPLLEREMDTGGIFFLGLGLTFLLVAVLPTEYGRMKWAYIPAGVLLLMGLLLLATSVQLINFVWPVLLIVGGVYFLWRAVRH